MRCVANVAYVLVHSSQSKDSLISLTGFIGLAQMIHVGVYLEMTHKRLCACTVLAYFVWSGAKCAQEKSMHVVWK